MRCSRQCHTELVLLSLCVIFAFWRGGKGIEPVWILSGIVFILTILPGVVPSHPSGASHSRWQRAWIVNAWLLLSWTVVSYLFSSAKNYGLDEVFQTAALVALSLWVIRMQSNRSLTVLPFAISTVLSAATAMAVVIGLMVYALQPIDRFVGTFFDVRFHTDFWPNAWAQFVLLAWPLMVSAIVQHWNKKNVRIALIATTGCVAGALYLSFSRGALLAAAGQSIVLGGAALAFGIKHGIRSIAFARVGSIVRNLLFGVLMAVVFVLVANGWRSQSFDVQSFARKATFTAAEGRSSVDERSQFWQQAFTLTKERPIVGWGPYSFRFTQTPLMQGVLATSDHPHNALLKFSSERGVPGALFLFAACVMAIGAALWNIVAKRNVASIFILTAFAGVVAHNMIDYNAQFLAIALPMTLLASMMIGDASAHALALPQAPAKRRFSMVHAIALKSTAVVLMAVLVWEGAQLGMSSVGRHAEAAGDGTTALRWYERSRNSLFSRDMYLSMARMYMERERIPDAQRALDSYKRLNEIDARAMLLQSELLLLQGKNELALDTLQSAYAMGKWTNVRYASLFLQALHEHDQDESVALLRDEMLMLFDAYGDAIERNAHFIALSSNPEALMTFSQTLQSAYPDRAQHIATTAQRAINHAEEERASYRARKSGILW